MRAGQFLRPKHTASLRLEGPKCCEGLSKFFVWSWHNSALSGYYKRLASCGYKHITLYAHKQMALPNFKPKCGSMYRASRN